MQFDKKGFPIYFKGNKSVLSRLTFKLDITIITNKPNPVSIDLLPRFNQKFDLLQPIIHVEIIDESQRQLIMKNRYSLKPEFFYVYYPSDVRVDEKIYRVYAKNYQNMLDEVPRNFKLNFSKLIIWEQGKGEHSIHSQIQKVNETLSFLGKQLIQRKIESNLQQLRSHQSQMLNSKALFQIFLLKSKMAKLYEHLGLPNCTIQFLQDIWNQMMANFRPLLGLKPEYKNNFPLKLDYPPQSFPVSPFLMKTQNDILGEFQSKQCSAYIRIVTFSFYKLFTFYLEQDYQYYQLEAVKSIKIFIDYILNNVLVMVRPKEWSKQRMILYDLSRNIWIYEVTYTCLKLLDISPKKKVRRETIMSDQSGNTKISVALDEYNRFHTGICSLLRNSIQKTGFLLYKLDNFSIFPKHYISELQFLMSKQQLPNEEQEGESQNFPSHSPTGIKTSDALPEFNSVPESTKKLFRSSKVFYESYIQVLQLMAQSLKLSPYKRVAESLTITIKKTFIMYKIDQRSCTTALKILNGNLQSRLDKVWSSINSLNLLYDVIIIRNALLNGYKSEYLLDIYKQKLTHIIYDYNVINEIRNGQQQLLLRFIDSCLNALPDNQSKLEIAQIVSSQVLELANSSKFTFNCRITLTHINKIYTSQSSKSSIDRIRQSIIMLLSMNRKVEIQARSQFITEQSNKIVEQIKIFPVSNLQVKQISEYLNENEQNCTQVKLQGCLDLEECSHQSFMMHISQIWMKIGEKSNLILIAEPQNQDIQYINLPKLQYSSELINHQIKVLPLYYGIWNPLTIELSPNITQFILKNIQVTAQTQLPFQVSDQILFRDIDKKQDALCKKATIENSMDINLLKKASFMTLFAKIKEAENQEISQFQGLVKVQIVVKRKENDKGKLFKLKINFPQINLQSPIKIQNFSLHHFSQYKVVSLAEIPFHIIEMGGQQDPHQLIPKEQIHLWSSEILISWQSCLQLSSLMSLKNREADEFKISYVDSSYRTLQAILIKSEKTGEVKVSQLQNGDFQILGRIQGNVSYLKGREQEKIIDMFLVPIRSGNLSLPRIQIGGCLGIWKKAYLIDVHQS